MRRSNHYEYTFGSTTANIDHRTNPTTVVSAGAGTGKTTTMIFVILKLIESGAFTADPILSHHSSCTNTLREALSCNIWKITAGTQVNF